MNIPLAPTYPIAVFDSDSTSAYSRLFYVFNGEIMVLRAFGMQDNIDRVDNSVPVTPQRICANMVLLGEGVSLERDASFALDPLQYEGEVIAEELIYTNGCPWMIEKCNNLSFIDVPGTYRFFLNDPTAVGKVFLYFNIIRKAEFLRHVSSFMGGV